ncbi:MAG: response regulator transcription factor [Ginsengibacter sp.]
MTARQADVLHLVLQGKSSKAICRELDISLSTVKTHTSAALRALNVTTRTQAVIAAGKMGLDFPTSMFLYGRRRTDCEAEIGATAGVCRLTCQDMGMTARQADVLHLVLQGKSSKAICRVLDISLSTVKTHTSAVLRALNVTTRTQAVIAAGKMGLDFPTSMFLYGRRRTDCEAARARRE